MVELETKERPIVLDSTVIVDHSRSKTPITRQPANLIQVVEGRQILCLHRDITRVNLMPYFRLVFIEAKTRVEE
jgi:hypothetical protein